MASRTAQPRATPKPPELRGHWLFCLLFLAGCTAKPPPTPASADKDPALFDTRRTRQPATIMNIARAARKAGDTVTAVRFYQRMLQQEPACTEALTELAELMLHNGAFHDAKALLDRVTPPDHPEALRLKGKMALALDQPQAALEFFQNILAQQPDNLNALEGAAVALDSMGDHARAHTLYARALNGPWTSRTLRSNYGLSLALGGRTDESVLLLKEVCQSEQATSRDRQNLGIALALKGDFAEATQWMSVDMDPAQVRENLASLRTLPGTSLRKDIRVPAPDGESLPQPPVSPAGEGGHPATP